MAKEEISKASRPPPIIVKFSNKDVRNQLYSKRSLVPQITNFGIEGGQYLYSTEYLTTYRKNLFMRAS